MNLPALVKVKKRIGRGIGSRGAKSGRGMKGQGARAGVSRRAGFEGGQTPLYQRLPKERGAKQIYASRVRHPARLTVQQLGRYADGDIVGPGVLRRAGLAGRYQRIKLVGQGVVDKKLTVRVHACTDHAREAVEAAGGTVELLTQA